MVAIRNVSSANVLVGDVSIAPGQTVRLIDAVLNSPYMKIALAMGWIQIAKSDPETVIDREPGHPGDGSRWDDLIRVEGARLCLSM